MRIDIMTLFPEMFSPLSHSILGRARRAGILEVHLWDIRNFTHDRHRTVDDTPYGGGAGMILKPEPVFETYEFIKSLSGRQESEVILLSPQGQVFSQPIARTLAQKDQLIFICGHYEGFDERIRTLVTMELSIGDYVLTGGELPAMVMVDTISRMLPGTLSEGSLGDSFSEEPLLEHPHYTRPYNFRGMKVPDVLLSGHHEKIDRWRRKQSLLRTRQRRPELLEKLKLSPEDMKLFNESEEDGR